MQEGDVPTLSHALGIPNNLFNLIESGRGYECPSLIYCVWKSGRHALMRLTCKSWRCTTCARRKLAEMTQALADATADKQMIYEITAPLEEKDNISRTLRRHKVSALSMKFVNGLYVLASEPVSGRKWESQEIIRLEAIIKVHSVDVLKIRRRDFTLDWRPEKTYEPQRDTVIVSRKFSDLEEARDVLEEFGQDLDSDLIAGDPLDLMERMLKSEGNLTLQIGG